MFGLVFAVLFKHFWIMAVIMMLCWIGHNADRKAAGCDRKHHGGSGMIWLIGIPILFFTGWWWPGIMILIGLSALKH
ncbi:MAG TPA: hypothetical protein VD886_11260 [Herpetosiphonaceae bacterium]|nr:hypothetical protein [Herpetosiphonaceae bacterium]